MSSAAAADSSDIHRMEPAARTCTTSISCAARWATIWGKAAGASATATREQMSADGARPRRASASVRSAEREAAAQHERGELTSPEARRRARSENRGGCRARRRRGPGYRSRRCYGDRSAVSIAGETRAMLTHDRERPPRSTHRGAGPKSTSLTAGSRQDLLPLPASRRMRASCRVSGRGLGHTGARRQLEPFGRHSLDLQRYRRTRVKSAPRRRAGRGLPRRSHRTRCATSPRPSMDPLIVTSILRRRSRPERRASSWLQSGKRRLYAEVASGRPWPPRGRVGAAAGRRVSAILTRMGRAAGARSATPSRWRSRSPCWAAQGRPTWSSWCGRWRRKCWCSAACIRISWLRTQRPARRLRAVRLWSDSRRWCTRTAGGWFRRVWRSHRAPRS